MHNSPLPQNHPINICYVQPPPLPTPIRSNISTAHRPPRGHNILPSENLSNYFVLAVLLVLDRHILTEYSRVYSVCLCNCWAKTATRLTGYSKFRPGEIRTRVCTLPALQNGQTQRNFQPGMQGSQHIKRQSVCLSICPSVSHILSLQTGE